tara:strand:+ start:996 stop:2204 length:1209 start_codon:yes stop_codon:yes gene_type:complete
MSTNDIIKRVQKGEIKLHELEEHVDPDMAADVRLQILESELSVKLSSIGNYTFDAKLASTNIENMIGSVQIPMGIAGPITVFGSATEGSFYLPLATTEGALVASVNRGCSAIRHAGGAITRIFNNAMTRAPVFKVANVSESLDFINWISTNYSEIEEIANSTTSHGELIGIKPYVVGNSIFLRFSYDTKDAMGMNMVTISTKKVSEFLEQQTPAKLISLSGNLCSDKKPAAINAIEGRGRTVSADVLIPRKIVEEKLHTTPEAIVEINTHKNHIGSARAVSLGHNAQAANIIAAIFLATGQDAAQVVEGANVITTADIRDGGLYLSVTLLSLEIGTIGGGTHLPSQSEALDILGVRGGGTPPGSNADAFAEIISSGVLAGELSLLSALGSRDLSTAHERLGR